MNRLRSRLFRAGVSSGFLEANVLPSWWEESVAETASGFRETATYISSYLGYSLKSLLNPDEELTLSGGANVKYKRTKLSLHRDIRLPTSIGMSIARKIAGSFGEDATCREMPAALDLRKQLLESSKEPWFTLAHLLNFAWDSGVPVVHVRRLPQSTKPDAMVTMIGSRPVIVIMSSKQSPSWISFILAHELGHIYHNHIAPGQTLVDAEVTQDQEENGADTLEEAEANIYAQELLIGNNGLEWPRRVNYPTQLVTPARQQGTAMGIAPGVAALNYAYKHKKWQQGVGALNILEKGQDAAVILESVLRERTDWDNLSDDAAEWIKRVSQSAE